MSHIPKVSVVIPLYQTERYIAVALKSVLAQTFTDFEVIVVDDGSSDRGPEIARSFKDCRVRVVSQVNRGLAGARNTGIREARAPYIALLDADDAWAADKLARHVAALDAMPRVGVSFSASRFIDDDGKPIGLIQRPSRRSTAARDIFCRNPVGNGSAPVIRRAALDAIAFFDASLQRTCYFDESFRQSEDIECWTRIAATTAWGFYFVDGVLTDYRVNSGGLSANTEKQLATWRRFRAKVRDYCPALEREAGDTAEAYQLRYLARRAVRSTGTASPALPMMITALKLHPQLLLEEPVRTAVTLLAAIAQRVLPAQIFSWVGERAMMGAMRMPSLKA